MQISKRILSQEQQRERPELDAPIRRLPSGRGYAANCGLARQPFRVHFLIPMQCRAEFHGNRPMETAHSLQYQQTAPPVTHGRNCHCLAATTLDNSRILLRPHSPTTAFRSRLLLLPPCRPLQGTGYQTGSHSGSRVSSGLPLIAHVASRCYSADLVVVCPRLPPGHSFRHDSRAYFSRQNTEAPAYPSAKGVHGSAPSSMRVTCKGFRPVHG